MAGAEIAPHVPAMRGPHGGGLGLRGLTTSSEMSTTTGRLGFTGRGEGHRRAGHPVLVFAARRRGKLSGFPRHK